MDFLRHHISARGIKLNTSKIHKILDWPIPTNSTEVQAFLGLVQYIASFLPKLAVHMYILIPLTNKSSKTLFSWTAEYQCAFESIKALVVRASCLTVVDHTNPGTNKIFCNLQCKQLVYRRLPKLWRYLGNSSTGRLQLDATWCCREELPDP